MDMTDLIIEYRPVASLVPYASNARTHSPAQIVQLVNSIMQFGWTNPILIDEGGTVIAGHGRLEAAKLLQIASVPTITLHGLDDAQRRALVIADNKLALNAGWDLEKLATELYDLETAEFDLSFTGFAPIELDTLLGTPVEPDQADQPVTPEQVWEGMPEYTHEDQTSAHRLIVHFETEADLKAFAKLVGQDINEKTKSIWYPKAERAQFSDKRYATA